MSKKTPTETKDMSKEVGEAREVARCADCLFGRGVTLEDRDKRGRLTGRRMMCECHVARPTRYGFPVVRPDDFCALHVGALTGERTFAGLVAAAGIGA